jgi:hypothetical protein
VVEEIPVAQIEAKVVGEAGHEAEAEAEAEAEDEVSYSIPDLDPATSPLNSNGRMN